jgi:hypothetical protein
VSGWGGGAGGKWWRHSERCWMNSWELVLALFSHLVSLILFFEHFFFFSFLWHVSHGTLKILNAIMYIMGLDAIMCIIIIYHNVYHGVLDVEVPLGFFSAF